MNEQPEKTNAPKPVRTLGENLQETLEILKRTEISLPQAIIIAAIVIALGIMIS
jgi:multisubunit Na+/H+ antiporter MnhC subunit